MQKCADVLKTVQVSQFKVPKSTGFSPEREEIIKLAPLTESEEKVMLQNVASHNVNVTTRNCY